MTDDDREKKTVRDAVTDRYADHFAAKEKRRAEMEEAAAAERERKRSEALAHHRKITGGDAA